MQKASGVPTGGLKEEKDEAAFPWGSPQISLYRGSTACKCSMFLISPRARDLKTAVTFPHNQNCVAFTFFPPTEPPSLS